MKVGQTVMHTKQAYAPWRTMGQMSVVNRHKGEKRNHLVRQPDSHGTITDCVEGSHRRGTHCRLDVISWRLGYLNLLLKRIDRLIFSLVNILHLW